MEVEIATYLTELERKYGEDFSWFIVKPDSSFVSEAYREISSDHPLFGMKLTCLAKCEANDDALFYTEHGQFVIIHLTYSKTNAAGFPRYQLFDTHLELKLYIEQTVM